MWGDEADGEVKSPLPGGGASVSGRSHIITSHPGVIQGTRGHPSRSTVELHLCILKSTLVVLYYRQRRGAPPPRQIKELFPDLAPEGQERWNWGVQKWAELLGFIESF